MALESGTRPGPYEILAPLGAGGMGEVYRARDTRLDRRQGRPLKAQPFAAMNPSLTADRNRFVVARSDSSFGIWTSDVTAARWTQTVPTTPVKARLVSESDGLATTSSIPPLRLEGPR